MEEHVVALDELGHPPRVTRPIGEMHHQNLRIGMEAHQRQHIDHRNEETFIAVHDCVFERMLDGEGTVEHPFEAE